MADTALQDFMALVPPQIRNADPSLCRLTGWVMTVSVASISHAVYGPNRCVCAAAPDADEAPACFPGGLFWEEPWDGTLAALRDLWERAKKNNEFDGQYVIVALERDWEAIAGDWGETANTVAVFPALCERVDRTEGNDLNAGLRDWLDRLDAAHLNAE